MEILGNLERLIDDLYTYRWPILIALIAAFSVVLWWAIHNDVHRTLWRHKLASALVAVPLLVIALPAGYYSLSPLWTRTTVIEESPLVASSSGEPSSETATPRTFAKPTNTPASAMVSIPTEAPAPTVSIAIKPTTEPVPAQQPEPPPPAVPEPTATPEPPPPPEPTPTTELPPPFEPHVVRSGMLTGADDFHFAEGTALLIEVEPGRYVLRLENVSVRNGPDLFVYLSPSAEDIVDGAVNLGDLKATDGSFNYDVPIEYDVSQFQGVIIWCRAFAVLFGTAPLF